MFNSVVLGMVAILAVGGALEQEPNSMVLIALLILLGVLLVGRSWRVGIIVTGEKVIHRQWFHHKSYDLGAIEDVTTKNYSGGWNFYSQSTFFSMIAITINKVEVDVPEVSGSAKHIRRVATQMLESFGPI